MLQPTAKIVDPLCTFLFSIIVICTTVKIFKKSANILLEGVPNEISFDQVANALELIQGVE